MAIDLNDEILQDFLVEAGEILEELNEQLVELEQSPDDMDLLNAIFRGFHTIKGGAGFLAIAPLVDVCHQAEDVFNVLRQGERSVSQRLMDVVLQVIDVVNVMFNQVRSGEDPTSADPQIIEELKLFAVAGGDTEKDSDITQTSNELAEEVGHAKVTDSSSNQDEISEEEFEELLDVLQEKNSGKAVEDGNTKPPSDDISDEEFELLLDDLHGEGKHLGIPSIDDEQVKKESGGSDDKRVADPLIKDKQTAPPDEITDDEFEALLDELHGSGKHGTLADEEAPGNKPIVTVPDTEATKVSDKTSTNNAELASEDALNVTKQSDTPKANNSEAEVRAKQPIPSAQKPAPESTKTVKRPANKPQKQATPPAETTVRVDTQRLDEIMNLVGELVLVRNRFENLKTCVEDDQISEAVASLDAVTADLQLSVMKTRMQPIKKVFGRFPRVVRDLARSLEKEVRLDLSGEETDLDKNLVEALADPLVHLVRNSVDHGIEMPDDRVAAGKPREGTVILTASQEGDHIQLTIEDDGKGMSADFLRDKVIEKGLMDKETASRLSDQECYNLIFLPGFSTNNEISDISGRGVGMDVVKTRISEMNGTVDVDSDVGRGTRIIIKVPLTLAIMPTLMVKLGEQAFALPLTCVVEILELDLTKTNIVNGQLVVIVRQRALPLFYLSQWLVNGYGGHDAETKRIGHVVIVNVSGRQVGFVVDHLIGQEEVVIKALGSKLQGLEGLSGATITGDGMIALILDFPSLMKKYAA